MCHRGIKQQGGSALPNRQIMIARDRGLPLLLFTAFSAPTCLPANSFLVLSQFFPLPSLGAYRIILCITFIMFIMFIIMEEMLVF